MAGVQASQGERGRTSDAERCNERAAQSWRELARRLDTGERRDDRRIGEQHDTEDGAIAGAE